MVSKTGAKIAPWNNTNKGRSKDWKDWKKVRRGVTHIGGQLPNEAMKYHNEMKILARAERVPNMLLKLPQGLRQAEKLGELERTQVKFQSQSIMGPCSIRQEGVIIIQCWLTKKGFIQIILILSFKMVN